MAIVCTCSACQTRFQVDDKFAGKKARCPKCSEVNVVGPATASPPVAPSSASPSKANAAPPISAAAPPSAAQASPSSSPFQIKTDQPTSPQIAASVPSSEGDDLGRKGRSSKGASKLNPILLVAGAGGSVVLVLLIGIAVWWSSSSDDGGKLSESVKANQDPGSAQLVLKWPPLERDGAAVTIDGQRQSVPVSGDVEFQLAAGAHSVVMQRRGFEQIDLNLSLKSGDVHDYTPIWKKNTFAAPGGGVAAFGNPAAVGPAGFSSWGQSLQIAQRNAEANGTQILMFFGGSDWEPVTKRLASQVLVSFEFTQFVKDRYELVVVDFPRTEIGYNRVDDPGQNTFLRKKYRVVELPSLALVDVNGDAYAVDSPETLDAANFVQWLGELDALRAERDQLLASAADSAAPNRIANCASASDWLIENRLTQFYEKHISDWLSLARQQDASNEAGHHEAIFHAHWMNQLLSTSIEDRTAINRIAKSLTDWGMANEFKNQDRAASLHLVAATLLLQIGNEAEALDIVASAQKFSPEDSELSTKLRRFQSAIKDLQTLGSGTGFAVFKPGYILTNHHVVEGPGKVVVRREGSEVSIPATVVAKDQARDLALVRIAADQAAAIPVINLSTTQVPRGGSIAAFGFPLGDAVGRGIKLTTGVVSGLPEATNEGMLLLDCTINPGNSGGPLCNKTGDVIGVVTAKSYGSTTIDSYGMAIPCKDVITFLGKAIPGYQYEAAEPAAADDWSIVNQRVSPSVVMVVKVR